MAKKQNIFGKALHMVKDTFAAYGQRFVPLFLFSLIFFGTIAFTLTYVADSLFAFITDVADNPTLANMESMPVEQIFVLIVILMVVLPLAMGGVLLLSPPGQDIMPDGERTFRSLNQTMTYLRAQYKSVFVSNITFFILLFFFYVLLQYILALFFMRFDAEALTVVTSVLLILAGIVVLPLLALMVTICLFEKTMGFMAVRRAISMAKANKGIYVLLCAAMALLTMGGSYLVDWALTVHVMAEWSKTMQFAVSAAWQAIIMPLPCIAMLLFYRRTLSLHDINVLFPS